MPQSSSRFIAEPEDFTLLHRDVEKRYNPSQPRDKEGQWTSGWNGFAGGPSYSSENRAFAEEDIQVAKDTIASVTGMSTDVEVQMIGIDQMHAIRGGGGTVGFYDVKRPGTITLNAEAFNQSFFLVHEYGHLIDAEHFQSRSKFASGDADSPLSGVVSAISSSPNARRWMYGEKGDYWGSRQEMFARAFSQYVTQKSGNQTLTESLARQADHQWSADEFGPISAEFDKLFDVKV